MHFIVNVQLNSTIRTAIGTQECKTFDNLKDAWTSRCKTKKTIPQIQNRLSCIAQGNDPIRIYSDKILKLINELIQELALTTETEKQNIKKLNELYALNILKQKLLLPQST